MSTTDGFVDGARVAVLAGGLSFEREVSLRSGRRIFDALNRAGVDAELKDVDTRLLPALTTDRPDAVVFALHGPVGEDGALQSVLDLVDIPYLGPTAGAARRAWDKPTAKELLRRADIATPDSIVLPRSTFSDLGASDLLPRVIDRLGLPLVVKPTCGGSGLGVRVVDDIADMPSAMIGCFAYGDVALMERYAPGIDVAVAVIETDDGTAALPAVEIAPLSGDYDYAARYNPGATRWHAPARLTSVVAAEVAEVAIDSFKALGLRDLSRIDMRVDTDGDVKVLEANVVPGMTETSLFPLAVETAGFDVGELLVDMVARTIRRHRSSHAFS